MSSEFLAVRPVVVGVSGGDMDADLVLTFLVLMLVSWLLVGMARGLSQLLIQQPFCHQSRDQQLEGCAAVDALLEART